MSQTAGIVSPQGISLLYWAAQLQTSFPADLIPILLDERDWRAWGNALLPCPTFANACAPQTDQFPDWRSWAEAFVRSLDV